MAQTLTYELLRFPNTDELAKAVAHAWLSEISHQLSNSQLPVLRSASDEGGSTYTVALSGGRIARQFFSAAATLLKNRNIPPIHFFWADERCVPPTDPESNFAVARELLFAPLGIPEDHIHRIRGEDPPDVAAAQAEAEICRIATLDANGQPTLDLIFLGMGEDGHVASLFPGESEETMANNVVYRAVIASKPPPHRITLGYPAIAVARQVWVLASGTGKEDALRESLSSSLPLPCIGERAGERGPFAPPLSTLTCRAEVRRRRNSPTINPLAATPLARVLQSRAHTRIFTDIPSE